MTSNGTATPVMCEKIQETLLLIAEIIQEFRELAEVQKEFFAGISQLLPLPPKQNFFTYDREQKEYLDSFWGSD